MKLIIAKEIPAIIIITLLMVVFMVVVSKKIEKADPLAKPKGIVFLGLLFVETIDNMVMKNMDEKAVKNFGPYIGGIAMYLLLANISGLSGFLNAPTASYSVTLSFAIITWILIQRQAFKTSGILGYIKNLMDPIPVFFLPNLFGQIAPFISLSIRLFGNILSGSVIMGIVYWATGSLSNLIFSLININASFNIFGVAIAPILHMYFDLFAGFMQMFVFISLTMVLIQKEKE
ncbi:MAG: F0F1 ATP synthase subunit A [Erysipelotrichaceae bacterium]|nr:F0F1 ATP synthase subunit A [Erysipelotrichaceae bacterium]